MVTATDGEAAGAEWRSAVLLTAGLTLARIVALFRTPLELYPDEAQYWLWSRSLDVGYYSKPPMIAWAIWATTALGGDAEPLVRLSAPLFQAGATLLVFAIARRLYSGPVALAAAGLYALAPAVQLSAVVVATDAPLLFFLGLTIWAYVALQTAKGRSRLLVAAGFGAALGLALLSKYAAAYAVIGLALHLILDRGARAAWSPAAAGLALAAFAVVFGPNLAWNAAHGFATLQHTAANADWGDGGLLSPHQLGDFFIDQALVFGPIPLAVLLGGGVLLALRRRLEPADLMLLCFALPPLAIVTVQALLSRANANWAGASYLPGAILAAAWLLRWRARGWLIAALASQALVAVLFLILILSPRTADTLGLANSFKRAKGWSEITRLVITRARSEPGLSAIAVNNRFLYNAMAYYGRNYFAGPTAAPLTVWLKSGTPQNQAEVTAPLTAAAGRRVLNVSLNQAWRDQMAADYRAVSGREILSVGLDRRHNRRAELFIGEDFRPRPRTAPSARPSTLP
ncbi:MAG: glycosyltransferase family 39 protein [Phenylobacterium sp.]